MRISGCIGLTRHTTPLPAWQAPNIPLCEVKSIGGYPSQKSRVSRGVRSASAVGKFSWSVQRIALWERFLPFPGKGGIMDVDRSGVISHYEFASVRPTKSR